MLNVRNLLFCILLLFPFSISLAAQNMQQDMQKAEVKKFVLRAEAYIKQNGKEAALKAFNNSHGDFVKHHLYIFAMDYKGVFLANINNPEMVGKNQIDLKNINGVHVTRIIIDKAKQGGGWVTYQWNDPTVNQVRCKTSYVMPIAGEYLIGSGYYTDDKKCK